MSESNKLTVNATYNFLLSAVSMQFLTMRLATTASGKRVGTLHIGAAGDSPAVFRGVDAKALLSCLEDTVDGNKSVTRTFKQAKVVPADNYLIIGGGIREIQLHGYGTLNRERQFDLYDTVKNFVTVADAWELDGLLVEPFAPPAIRRVDQLTLVNEKDNEYVGFFPEFIERDSGRHQFAFHITGEMDFKTGTLYIRVMFGNNRYNLVGRVAQGDMNTKAELLQLAKVLRNSQHLKLKTDEFSNNNVVAYSSISENHAHVITYRKVRSNDQSNRNALESARFKPDEVIDTNTLSWLSGKGNVRNSVSWTDTSEGVVAQRLAAHLETIINKFL